MDIRVEYVAQMRQASGVAAEVVSVTEPCSVQRLLEELARRHGERFRAVVLDSAGAVRPSTLVFVSDEQVDLAGPRDLAPGDRVTLLAPLAGG